MAYQVLARKWRPQNFDEVVFQDHVSKTIKNSIKNNRIFHAYLFAGPRGVGKTTMARIVAKALNCVHGPTDTPCGVCEHCVEIRAGNSFDVIEIDGASNRGIENIRELRENVKFAPLKSRYKIYIIDEVHMLTREAFNALLKTLEEPPDHIVFIFATTAIHQVPDTILSRCQKYFFKKISTAAIVEHLRYIVGQEQYSIDERSLYPIARSSDGSMRDAQSLLEQVVSFSEGEIREEDTLAILGVVPFASYVTLMRFIGEMDVKGAMGEVDRVISLGVDIPRYAAGLQDVVRALRLILNRVSVQEILELSDDEVGLFGECASLFFDEDLSVIFQISVDLIRDLRYSSNDRVNLEMAILDMISVRKNPSISSILKRLEGGEVGDAEVSAPSSAQDGKQKEVRQEKKEDVSVQKLDPEKTQQLWNALLEDIREQEKAFLHEKLRVARAEYVKGVLHVRFNGDADNFYRGNINAEDLDYLKKLLYQKTGKHIRIAVDFVSPPPADAAGGEEAPPADAQMMRNPEVDEMKTVNPSVEKVKDIFHGQIIQKGDE